jgi:hypothetical protein
VHIDAPIPQGIEDEPADDGMVAVERISAAGIVLIASAVVEHIIDRIVEPAETEGRTVFVTLARVVVDHVEDDLDARLVESLDHFLELPDGGEAFTIGGVPRRWREKRERGIAPYCKLFREIS